VSESLYERDAAGFIAWARTPGHDSYWSYAPDFFAEVVPPPGRATREIGCGEGRVCRDLAARGHRVVGLDAAPTLVAAAREADPGGTYVVGDAVDSREPDAPFRIEGSYLARGRRRSLTLERGGLRFTFEDAIYPLEDYARALEDAGLLVERLREPAHRGGDERKRRIPQFLWLRAVKP
jgi:SAM-dependent methyltransferase